MRWYRQRTKGMVLQCVQSRVMEQSVSAGVGTFDIEICNMHNSDFSFYIFSTHVRNSYITKTRG